MPAKAERKSVELPGFGEVRPNLHTGHCQLFSELNDRWIALGRRFNQFLENLFWRLLAGANSHVDFASSQPFFAFLVITDCLFEPVLFFQHLGQINGLSGFPFAVPHRAIQPNPAGDHVHVVVASIVVSNGEKLMAVPIETHTVHVVMDHGLPLVVGKPFTRWQRQR
jgi:hypothetical protein